MDSREEKFFGEFLFMNSLKPGKTVIAQNHTEQLAHLNETIDKKKEFFLKKKNKKE